MTRSVIITLGYARVSDRRAGEMTTTGISPAVTLNPVWREQETLVTSATHRHPGIVIVDDNRVVREAIAQLLEEHQFFVWQQMDRAAEALA